MSDEEWAFVAPYLTLITEDAPQRVYNSREVYNGLKYIARCGAPWRWLPNDLPHGLLCTGRPNDASRQRPFPQMLHDLREILRMGQGRNAEPTAVILDSVAMLRDPAVLS